MWDTEFRYKIEVTKYAVFKTNNGEIVRQGLNTFHVCIVHTNETDPFQILIDGFNFGVQKATDVGDEQWKLKKKKLGA